LTSSALELVRWGDVRLDRVPSHFISDRRRPDEQRADREIGHLHGDHAAHFGFGAKLGAELKADGRVVDHPVFPGKPGPAARRIETDEDVAEVIELIRLNYDRVVERYGLPAEAA
jgi:Luciferase